MPSTEGFKIEEGMVIGVVCLSLNGCRQEVEVCTVEEYEEMDDEQAEKALLEAIYESGQLDIFIKHADE